MADLVEIAFPSEQKAEEVRQIVRHIQAIEAWNTMVALGYKQFAGREAIDIKPTMDLLKASSQKTYDEYELRLRRHHVVGFDEAVQGWKEKRPELLAAWQKTMDEQLALDLRRKKERNPKLPIGAAKENAAPTSGTPTQFKWPGPEDIAPPSFPGGGTIRLQ